MAPGKASVTVEGGPQLARAFHRLGDRLDDMRSVHDDAASVVAERARNAAPRRSGALADTVRVEPTDTGSEVTAGDHDVPYAGPIHYGWRDRNIEPQPFLTDALEDGERDVTDRYADGIGDMIRRFDREAP